MNVIKKLFSLIYRVSIEEDWLGRWKRTYIFNKCIREEMLKMWEYV